MRPSFADRPCPCARPRRSAGRLRSPVHHAGIEHGCRFSLQHSQHPGPHRSGPGVREHNQQPEAWKYRGRQRDQGFVR